MLVNIYGSKDLFVAEFANLLADRLLALNDFNAEREIHNVELLKAKFGEAALIKCEVMLKDVADSKRFFTYASDKKKGQAADELVDEKSPLRATIVSALFWPKLDEDELKLPVQIEVPLRSSFLSPFTGSYSLLE